MKPNQKYPHLKYNSDLRFTIVLKCPDDAPLLKILMVSFSPLEFRTFEKSAAWIFQLNVCSYRYFNLFGHMKIYVPTFILKRAHTWRSYGKQQGSETCANHNFPAFCLLLLCTCFHASVNSRDGTKSHLITYRSQLLC